jgi:peroxiredoxin
VRFGAGRHRFLRHIMSNSVPAVGQTAPDFTLPSTGGSAVTLSALRGKNVLLAFFPLAFTSTCTQELCDMRDDWDQFATDDTVVIPISVDSTPTLKEFKNKYSLQSDFLSDFKRDVARLYGVLLEDRFYSNRAYFLIDKSGTIRWVHVEANPSEKRSNAELLEQIGALHA